MSLNRKLSNFNGSFAQINFCKYSALRLEESFEIDNLCSYNDWILNTADSGLQQPLVLITLFFYSSKQICLMRNYLRL